MNIWEVRSERYGMKYIWIFEKLGIWYRVLYEYLRSEGYGLKYIKYLRSEGYGENSI